MPSLGAGQSPCPTWGFQGGFGPIPGQALGRGKWGPRRNPAQRFCWGEAEQRNERVFALLGGNEGYVACDDEEQEKALALLLRLGGHFRPQCGRFPGTGLTLF